MRSSEHLNVQIVGKAENGPKYVGLRRIMQAIFYFINEQDAITGIAHRKDDAK
jgi:hypothetical protein